MRGKLGLIAGGGALPLAIAARCEAEGRPVFVVRLTGFADPHLVRYPGLDAGMAEIGKALTALKKAGCTAVCFAGHGQPPGFQGAEARSEGRDAAARASSRRRPRATTPCCARSCRCSRTRATPSRAPTTFWAARPCRRARWALVAPSDEQLSDLRKALHVAEKAGELDIGQGAVVCDGLVLAVEAQEGTDAMLGRVAGLPADLRGADREPQGRAGQGAQADPGPARGHARHRAHGPSRWPPPPVWRASAESRAS